MINLMVKSMWKAVVGLALSIQMKVVVGNELTELYPKTSASNVYMTDGSTVQSTLSALKTKVDTMYDKLYFDSLYMTDSSGTPLNDNANGDGTGTNLVAVY